MFREDSKRFYRELGKKTIQTEKLPDIGGRTAANQPDGVEGPHN